VVVDDARKYSPESVRQVVTKGFYVLDEGVKNWLSGIKVQVKDVYKIASVHYVTQDRSILAWAQEFFNGRVSLPVISLKRTTWNFDQTLFRPPYIPMARQMTDNSGKRMRLIYQPLPFKIEYALSIWSEFRHDAEFIQTDIIKRCSPLGEIVVQDEYTTQYARIMLGGVNDSSDIDLGAKDRPKVVYDISLTVEYAIPVNERIVPTVLGKVVTVKESDTDEVFDVYRVGDIA